MTEIVQCKSTSLLHSKQRRRRALFAHGRTKLPHCFLNIPSRKSRKTGSPKGSCDPNLQLHSVHRYTCSFPAAFVLLGRPLFYSTRVIGVDEEKMLILSTRTFLKRKGGLFKKAHELSVLCSVDVAVIIFGHNKKLYEYSSGDINETIGRFQYVWISHLRVQNSKARLTS